MQNETAGEAFLEFGSTYKKINDSLLSNLSCSTKIITAHNTISQFTSLPSDSYIEIQSGIGILLVSRDPQTQPIRQFGMNQHIHIKPHIYFGFIATTPELVLKLYSEEGSSLDILTLNTPYEFHPVLPRIQVLDILGYYYRIRTQDYRFRGEQHDFFELTYVDTGLLYTEVDGKVFTIGEKEMIIYGPGQYHTQYTSSDSTASYVTIMFHLRNLSPNHENIWYSPLINKVFPYNKKIYTLVKTLVQESTSGLPYMDTLMHCLLTETIIRLLQGEYANPINHPAARVARQNYQDELFERILAYIEANICEPLTVAEICQKFSLSRSSLQILFKSMVNQSPKKYISDMKLERSCRMLRENKYTISEISLKLGYSSVHYFSNAFNQKYHISPSEYARRIY